MISTLREPLPVGYIGAYQDANGVYREDNQGSDILVIAQILYVFGLLGEEDFTLDHLNQLLGRNYGDPHSGHAVTLLYEAGIRCHNITTITWEDVERWVNSYQAWLEDARKYDPNVQNNRPTRRTYARVRRTLVLGIEYRERYGHLVSTENREPSIEDVDRLLADGWYVVIPVDGTATTVINGLIYGKDGDSYLVYHPVGALIRRTAAELLAVDGEFESIEAWKLPS